MRRAFALVPVVVGCILAACNQVYGLEQTQLLPEQAHDDDGDGVLDSFDNCPSVANPAQSDDDRDGVGDVCDNCPIIANTEQRDEGDHDGIGDRCDPHPALGGDCVVVYDSFSDPAAFADHWNVIATGTAAARPEAGAIVLDAPSGSITILARDRAGNQIDGRLDVQLAARHTPTDTSEAGAVTSVTATTRYECYLWLLFSRATLEIRTTTPGVIYRTAQYMFTPPFGDDLVMRLSVDASEVTGEPACRVDFGSAVSFGRQTGVPVLTSGGTGASARNTVASIDGIVIYRFEPTGAPCADSIVW